MKIGEVAKRTDIGIETIRYYERTGLLPAPKRRESGYREYKEDTVKRLQFIRHAKELGFSLKETAELLSLHGNSRSTCAQVKKRADVKIDEIEQKIKALQKIKSILKKLSDECKGDSRSTKECPILEAIESN